MTEPPRPRLPPGLRRIARPFLLVAGIGFAGFLVWRVGPGRVLGVLRDAGAWLPLVALLEMGFVATDIVGLRFLLGEHAKGISRTSWARSTALAYASTILLPTGRAAGEATRAAVLSVDVGVPVAAGVCARLQAAVLVANAVISVLIAGVLFATRRGITVALSLAMLGNALACAVLGTLLYAVLRGEGLWRWLARTFPRIAARVQRSAGESATRTQLGSRGIPASIVCGVVGRLVQTAQFAVVMRAVGGLFTVPAAMTAQGVQIVGSTVGDVFPAQLGAAEGSYYACAGMLGLGSDPARAISIRILVLTAQLGLAVACLLVAASIGPARAPRAAEAARAPRRQD
jgi:hypothetical protein